MGRPEELVQLVATNELLLSKSPMAPPKDDAPSEPNSTLLLARGEARKYEIYHADRAKSPIGLVWDELDADIDVRAAVSAEGRVLLAQGQAIVQAELTLAARATPAELAKAKAAEEAAAKHFALEERRKIDELGTGLPRTPSQLSPASHGMAWGMFVPKSPTGHLLATPIAEERINAELGRKSPCAQMLSPRAEEELARINAELGRKSPCPQMLTPRAYEDFERINAELGRKSPLPAPMPPLTLV